MVIALAKKKKVTAIDFNSTAPAAAKADMFPLDAKGAVKDGMNVHGWLAVGVPGIPAGLQLSLDRYGTQTFRTLVQPAIRYARDGFPVPAGLAATIQSARAGLLKDPASAKLFFDGAEPLTRRTWRPIRRGKWNPCGWIGAATRSIRLRSRPAD